jgi:GH15 family glucan-1,4-alpha-glucosidase
VGNDAADQRQLDIYGHVLQTAWLYVESGGALHGDAGRRVAGIADLVCERWREADSGIWEVRSEPSHFTESKMMCWIALERAQRLAERGAIPAGNTHRWRREQEALREFIAERCWSDRRGAYLRAAGRDEPDASLLLPAMLGYGGLDERERLLSTASWIRERLGEGPLLYRYRGEDGLEQGEGAFLACSFWMVDALAGLGRREEASVLMEELLSHANDLGLFAEEIDPRSGELLGNLPQGLVHLALINAAHTLEEKG